MNWFKRLICYPWLLSSAEKQIQHLKQILERPEAERAEFILDSDEYQGTWVGKSLGVQLLTGMLLETLGDAPNFVTMELAGNYKGKHHAMIVTIRRATGQTVEEKYMEVCQEMRILKEAIGFENVR